MSSLTSHDHSHAPKMSFFFSQTEPPAVGVSAFIRDNNTSEVRKRWTSEMKKPGVLTSVVLILIHAFPRFWQHV